jgi:hypothetical protein
MAMAAKASGAHLCAAARIVLRPVAQQRIARCENGENISVKNGENGGMAAKIAASRS